MRVCFVSPEVFAWGYYGGFGFLTRTLGRELVRRGVEVSVVTVRREGQGEVQELDGMTVYGFPTHGRKTHALRAILSRLGSLDYYREANCEIYHSQAVSYNTLVAQMVMPRRLHIITFQDPYDLYEWERISRVDPRYKLAVPFKTRLMLENRVLSLACHKADVLYAQAGFLADRAKRLFRLTSSPEILPNPVEIPGRAMKKSDSPLVCFLARWDPQKRVKKFLNLSRAFPDVSFIAMGRSHDKETDLRLRGAFAGIPNLVLTGFVSEDEKSRILERSWALVNTSVREALPVSFLEALVHEATIISGEDPNSLTTKYGYHVEDEDYAQGLERMLHDEERRDKGRRGREYVEKNHELGRVADLHIEIYEGLLEGDDDRGREF
ncbi:MAG: glycosyltransferase family 4 protein [Candidatus Bathyarchaeota archaeon]|nr:MAG: glycosyltransferase family 4 protein [Candidatus Bathyarchaeota archaeon]